MGTEFKWVNLVWKHCLAMQLITHNLMIEIQKLVFH